MAKAKRDKAPADKRKPKHSNDAGRANKQSKNGLRDASTVRQRRQGLQPARAGAGRRRRSQGAAATHCCSPPPCAAARCAAWPCTTARRSGTGRGASSARTSSPRSCPPRASSPTAAGLATRASLGRSSSRRSARRWGPRWAGLGCRGWVGGRVRGRLDEWGVVHGRQAGSAGEPPPRARPACGAGARPARTPSPRLHAPTIPRPSCHACLRRRSTTPTLCSSARRSCR